jgi:hypothetical protein
MSAHRKPLGVTAERVAAVLERDPTTEFGWRWRRRPLSMFDDERVWATWNARFAGKRVGALGSRGRVSVTIDHETYDLRRIEKEFGEAIDAIASSSDGLPDDGKTSGNAGESGTLAQVLHAAARTGSRLSDLTVLGVKRDPYRMDKPAKNREGRWFAEWLDRLFPDSVVHLRGFHYALVSHGGVTKPDGSAYENTSEDYFWLIDDAAKAARWLGHVGFDRFVDQRNNDPIEYRRAPEPVSTPVGGVSALLFSGHWQSLTTGELNISPPRKLQALRDLEFPGLRAEVAPVSLTLGQVIAERLPTTPVKVTEKRGKGWQRAFGPALRVAGLVTGDRPAQVEIDALAVLRPEVLTRITHEKIALYRDRTIERRARPIRERWHRAAWLEVDAQLPEHQGRLNEIKQAAEEAAEHFNEARGDLVEAVEEARETFLEKFEEARQAFVDRVTDQKEALDDAQTSWWISSYISARS